MAWLIVLCAACVFCRMRYDDSLASLIWHVPSRNDPSEWIPNPSLVGLALGTAVVDLLGGVQQHHRLEHVGQLLYQGLKPKKNEKQLLLTSGSQRNVAYLGWPIAGGGGGGGLLSQWVQLYTWSPNKIWRSNSIFNLCYWLIPGLKNNPT